VEIVVWTATDNLDHTTAPTSEPVPETPKRRTTALPDVMRYKNPTPNPLPASDEGAKMYLIRAETAVKSKPCKTGLKKPNQHHLILIQNKPNGDI
jgi:hypothetical protein